MRELVAAVEDLAECTHPGDACEGDDDPRVRWCTRCGARRWDGDWRRPQVVDALAVVLQHVGDVIDMVERTRPRKPRELASLDARERERVANLLAVASRGTREAIGMIESARRCVDPQAFAGETGNDTSAAEMAFEYERNAETRRRALHTAANDDDPAGALDALRAAGERLDEVLALHARMLGFAADTLPQGFEEASDAVVRRLEVAFSDYVKAEERLRVVQEGGNAP